MLNWANLSERAQKIKGLNFCASQFVTEDEVKYCVAKLFSGDVKFATAVLFLPSSLSLIQSSTDPARSTSCKQARLWLEQGMRQHQIER